MAASDAPWVLELSAGTFRSGFAEQELVTSWSRVPCSSAPPEAQAAASTRDGGDKAAMVAAIDWVASTTGAGSPTGITLVVPSGFAPRRQRELARELLEGGHTERLFLVHAASAHAVGAGMGSAVVVDAGFSGTDACFAGPAATVAKGGRHVIPWSGAQLTELVKEQLSETLGRAVSQDDAARAKEALASLPGVDPSGDGPFVLPDGTALARDEWVPRLRTAVEAAWAEVSTEATDAVGHAMAAAESDSPGAAPSILLTGAASRLPGFAARLAADLATSSGKTARVVRSATAEENGFLGGFFLSSTSMYDGKLAMTKRGLEEEGVRHLMLGTGSRIL